MLFIITWGGTYHMKIDEIDLNIISELQKDSRISIRKLSKKVNLSPPSVNERVKRMEENGIIEGYTIKINRKKLGLTIQCIVEITLEDKYKYTSMLTPSLITNYPGCEHCFRMAGDSSFFVVLSASSINEIEEFAKQISQYKNFYQE